MQPSILLFCANAVNFKRLLGKTETVNINITIYKTNNLYFFHCKDSLYQLSFISYHTFSPNRVQKGKSYPANIHFDMFIQSKYRGAITI
jgi:hypothetical protein